MVLRTTLLLLLLTSGCAPPASPPAPVQAAVVTRVVDGDTFWLRGLAPGPVPVAGAERVRVIGIDTPELRPPRCWGREASAYARAVLPPGTRVQVRSGPEPRDRYGRMLLHVLLPDGSSYAESAVRDGHAVAYLVRPEREFAARIRSAEREARRAGRGLWKRCASVDDATPRRSRWSPGSTTPSTGPRSPPSSRGSPRARRSG